MVMIVITQMMILEIGIIVTIQVVSYSISLERIEGSLVNLIISDQNSLSVILKRIGKQMCNR